MRLVALEIPDDPAELPGWLEGQLLGLDLAAVVAEFEAVHPAPPTRARALAEVLGNDRAAVLDRGLTALPAPRLRYLLRRPRLLLDLQELVLVEGGAYWQRLAAGGPDPGLRVATGWLELDAFLTGGGAGASGGGSLDPRPRTRPNHLRWIVSLATAASLLAAVTVYQRTHPGPASRIPVATTGNWGWLRPGAFPHALPASAYLEHLAEEAEEWFGKRPDQPAALARRIAELRQGCTALILAPHPSLSDQDRQWLVKTCRPWATDLDQRLAEVESGEDPLWVRTRTDETVRRIVQELRNRAAARA